GGCGALYDGASPDGSRDQRSISRTHQAYGRNYQLPNTTAHNETCAAIGSVLWNWRMFLATGEPRFVDVMELALHNAVLSGVGLDGTNFFYTNPLRVTDPMPAELRWSRRRVPFVSSFCCPPNVLRTLAESAGYAYAKSSNTIWVNLYGMSTLTTKLGANTVMLAQETEYPWNGRARVTVRESSAEPFALKVRVPGWAKSAAARLNGALVETPLAAGTYAEFRRVWRPGDVLEIDLPMSVRLLEANPLVEETLNQLAVQRGPTVYCLESADLPPDTRIMDVAIPAGIDFVARYDQRLLGGCVVLEGMAQVRNSPRWKGELYREFGVEDWKPLRIALVPYSLWANRGRGEMTVWLPSQ
ncbi:MAG TPA: beta-L-arabinofuranosidase domain-containing protein, partial [Verrucomicrobiae bacterium]|nr:beta-L-arabinofuranosidase domain-containing protein [Verrucomicrobiae bacterium]